MADRVGKRWGVGRAIIGGWALAAVAALFVPLAAGSTLVVVLILAFAKAFGALTDTVANVHQWSLRQTVTPDYLAGRVTASHRFIVYGAGACGAMLGGVAATAVGLRPALLVCAIGMLLGPLVAVVSPLRGLRQQPIDETETEWTGRLSADSPVMPGAITVATTSAGRRRMPATLTDKVRECLRRDNSWRWSAGKACTDPWGTRWRHQMAASIWSSDGWLVGLIPVNLPARGPRRTPNRPAHPDRR